MTSSTKGFRLTYITDDPYEASTVATSGVDRIMVDLEFDGKIERQGHLDTVISRHTPQAINCVAKALEEIGQGEVLVRLNPINENSVFEVDGAISRGAQRLMLPMFRTASEVNRFLDLVAGRVPVTLLLETKDAYKNLDTILQINGYDEIHIGLNDLHLEMGLDFMFQLLINGVVDDITKQCRAAGRTFGIGGVAPLTRETKLSPTHILAYHVFVGSKGVILSRDWRQYLVDPEKYAVEVRHLRDYLSGSPILNWADFQVKVEFITKLIHEKKESI